MYEATLHPIIVLQTEEGCSNYYFFLLECSYFPYFQTFVHYEIS